VMIDSLFGALAKASASPIIEDMGLEPGQYAVATLHRPANVDDAETLHGFLKAFEAIAERSPIILPAHPRTMASIVRHGLVASPRVRIIEPLGYVEFLRLWSQSALVLTDSGGMQEETTVLGIPCLTLRENTERPITVSQGTNRVVGTDPRRIVEVALKELSRGTKREYRVPEMWDGQASERIVDALLSH
jgi:UDP-N-acetylglucosamine 2-epimerase (non-hydrolysing)